MNDFIKTKKIQANIIKRDKIIKKISIVLDFIVVFIVLFSVYNLSLFDVQWIIVLLHAVVVLIVTQMKTENRLLILINPRIAMLNRLIINKDVLDIGGDFSQFRGSYDDYLKKIEKFKLHVNIDKEIDWMEADKAVSNIWLNSFVIVSMILVSFVWVFIPLIMLGSVDQQLVFVFYMFSYLWRVLFVLTVDMLLIIFETKQLIVTRDTISIYIYTRSYFKVVFENGLWSLFRLEKYLYDFDYMISNNILFPTDVLEDDIE